VKVAIVGSAADGVVRDALAASRFCVTELAPLHKADVCVVILRDTAPVPPQVTNRTIPRFVYRW
jgi:hypothetical protein